MFPLFHPSNRNPELEADATANTRSAWRRAFDRVFRRSAIDDELWDELEEALIISDVGAETANRLVGRVKHTHRKRRLESTDEVKSALRADIADIFATTSNKSRSLTSNDAKSAVMVVGVNGSGKTTSIGKLAHTARRSGKDVVIAAADTFRAGAIKQAEIWAERTGARCISTQPGGDPGAVVVDAMRSAKSQSADYVIVDTAGRLHTSSNLMDELQKVRRILDRDRGEFDVRVLLVLDANLGQNGIRQAQAFDSAVDVDGVILTKLDSTARGGIAIAVSADLQLPIWYIGTGERIDDIAEFDGEEFAAALLP